MVTLPDLGPTSGQASRVGSVILCCATEDQASAETAAATLRERGHDIRVLTGVDVRVPALEDPARGLWVLLRTPRLSGSRIDDLRKRLRNLGVPFERTLTVADPSPRLVVERVEQALLRSGGSFRGPPIPPPPPDSGVIPTTAAESGTADELTTVGRKRSAGQAMSGEHELIDPDELDDLDGLPDEPPFPELPTAPESPAIRTGHTLETMDRPPEPIVGGPTFRIANDPGRLSDPDADEVESPTTPMASNEVRADALQGLLDDIDAEGSPWWKQSRYLGLTTVAVLVVLGLGLWAFSDDEDSKALARADTPSDDERSDPQAATDAPDVSPPDPGPAMPGRATRVMKALGERRLRALDTLLVVPEQSDPMTYAAALQHCATLSVYGLSGWRIPTLGELGSLDRGGMLDEGFYWSSTPADAFGDITFSWYGKADRPVTRDEDAPVLCVRDSNAEA